MDIVERLRDKWIKELTSCVSEKNILVLDWYDAENLQDLIKAKDEEIERLREALADIANPCRAEGERVMDIVERLTSHWGGERCVDVSIDVADAIDEIKRLRVALKELLNVVPNFPPEGDVLVGMKERYKKALIEARTALKESK